MILADNDLAQHSAHYKAILGHALVNVKDRVKLGQGPSEACAKVADLTGVEEQDLLDMYATV